MGRIKKDKNKFQVLSQNGSTVSAIYLSNDENRVPPGTRVIVSDNGGLKYYAPQPPFENQDGGGMESFSIQNIAEFNVIDEYKYNGIFSNSCFLVQPKEDIELLQKKYGYFAIRISNSELYIVNDNPQWMLNEAD